VIEAVEEPNRMRFKICAGATASALVLGLATVLPVNAADLGSGPVRPPADFAPPYEPRLIERWTGFYMGATLGYGFGEGRATGAVGAIPFDQDGALATVLAGYNWQQGALVIGLEADLGTGWMQSNTSTLAGVLQTDLNAIGSFRGRLGFLATPSLMLYGTAGLAWANMDFRLQGTQAQSETFFGYQIGAGGEMMLNSNMALRLEYIYTDLGAERVTHGGGINTYDPDFHTVRAGIAFKF
jgi:outer membrane immunogenic protein